MNNKIIYNYSGTAHGKKCLELITKMKPGLPRRIIEFTACHYATRSVIENKSVENLILDDCYDFNVRQ